jgi:hypothetical protein
VISVLRQKTSFQTAIFGPARAVLLGCQTYVRWLSRKTMEDVCFSRFPRFNMENDQNSIAICANWLFGSSASREFESAPPFWLPFQSIVASTSQIKLLDVTCLMFKMTLAAIIATSLDSRESSSVKLQSRRHLRCQRSVSDVQSVSESRTGSQRYAHDGNLCQCRTCAGPQHYFNNGQHCQDSVSGIYRIKRRRSYGGLPETRIHRLSWIKW